MMPTGQELTLIGALVVAIGVVWRLYMAQMKKSDEQRTQEVALLREELKSERDVHKGDMETSKIETKEERKLLLVELKLERENSKEEKKEYQKSIEILTTNFNNSLNDNTLSIRENTCILQEVSLSLSAIPIIREEVKTLGEDMEKIKEYVFISSCTNNNNKNKRD